jgi:S1-C subfamily serine protease
VAVLAVYDPHERRYTGLGSAFHVGRGFFYTSAHVVLAGRRFQQEEPKFERWILLGSDEFGSPRAYLGTAEASCVDRRYRPDPYGEPQPFDIAAVRLTDAQRPLPPALPLSQSRVAVGDRVRALGFPETAVLFEMRGTVVEVAPHRIVVERDRGTVVLGGSSGSPLFSARDEVIGVLQAGNAGGLVSHSVPIQIAVGGCPVPRD